MSENKSLADPALFSDGIFCLLSTAILAIWLPYTALIINIAVWILWIWLSLKEKE